MQPGRALRAFQSREGEKSLPKGSPPGVPNHATTFNRDLPHDFLNSLTHKLIPENKLKPTSEGLLEVTLTLPLASIKPSSAMDLGLPPAERRDCDS